MSEENQFLEPESNTTPEQSAVNTDTDTSNNGNNGSDTNTQDTQPKLYAGKYKSIEDLEAGYKNLEKKLGQKQPERPEGMRLRGTGRMPCVRP